MKEYFNRLIESTIQQKMDAMGCVAIDGPKWCGKSTTAERYAKTVVKLQDPIVYKQYSALAETSRELLLAGEKPLMFDEWQKIPTLWDFIRTAVDVAGESGQYIITGSAKPIEDPLRHSGAGRITKVTMRPMSLWESKESTGEVSLEDLFSGNKLIFGNAQMSITELAHVVCRGGWPEAVTRKRYGLSLIESYFNALVDSDVVNVDGIKRNPKTAKAVLAAYARNISTFAKQNVLSADCGVDEKTLKSYISAFEKLFVIDDILPWSPKLRSAATIRAAAKRQFVDPSVAAVACGKKPADFIGDLETFGFYFESLCDRDLKIYAQSLGGELFHYHDSSDLEVDAVVHLNDGRWGAIEIKLGGNQIDEAAQHLLELKNKIDFDRFKQPSFLMVLTGAPNAYMRTDGVAVVPLACLKN
jgi:predicted AAA+ superfamily ATPase